MIIILTTRQVVRYFLIFQKYSFYGKCCDGGSGVDDTTTCRDDD